MPLCSKCLLNGIWVDMTKVAFEFPDFNGRIQNKVNFTARECPRCHYQAPLDSWGFWNAHRKPNARQRRILNEQGGGPPLVF